MQLQQTFSHYIDRMISGFVGMKILLLDEETTYLLDHEVFLIDFLSNGSREQLASLKCICFLRPTSHNVELLRKELAKPLYAEYYLCNALLMLDFNNFAKGEDLEKLAEADEFAVVKEVQEFYGDYYPASDAHFHFNIPHVVGEQMNAWSPKAIHRCTESLVAVLLSLKRKPLIRYDLHSQMAQKLAMHVQQLMDKESRMFDFRTPDTPPVLLVLDRRTDLITPLLLPWTYQAMLHDLFTIRNGKLQDSSLQDSSLGGEDVLLQDPFFKDNKYSNYGQIGENVQKMVRDLERKTRESSHLDSIPDMKRFVEEYPEYRKLSANASKHFKLAEQINKRVEGERLLDLSEVQQTLATGPTNYNSHYALLNTHLRRSDLKREAKMILALIFALRYSQNAQFNFLQLHEALGDGSGLIDFLLKFTLKDPPTPGKIAAPPAAEQLSQRTVNMLAFSQESVYTQHVPPVVAIVDNLMKGKLSSSQYPGTSNSSLGVLSEKPQDIIVFIVNGSTFGEEFALQKLAQAVPAVSILLGSNCIHNTASLLSEAQRLHAYFS